MSAHGTAVSGCQRDLYSPKMSVCKGKGWMIGYARVATQPQDAGAFSTTTGPPSMATRSSSLAPSSSRSGPRLIVRISAVRLVMTTVPFSTQKV